MRCAAATTASLASSCVRTLCVHVGWPPIAMGWKQRWLGLFVGCFAAAQCRARWRFYCGRRRRRRRQRQRLRQRHRHRRRRRRRRCAAPCAASPPWRSSARRPRSACGGATMGQVRGDAPATRHARVPRGCQCRLLSSQGCVAQCHPATASLPVGPFQWVWQALGAGAGRGKRYAAGCVSHVRQWAHVCGGCAMCNNARRRRHHQQLARRGAAEPDRAQDVLETEEVAAAGR